MFYRLLLVTFLLCAPTLPAWAQDFNIVTVAGDGSTDYDPADDGNSATEASLSNPHGVDVDSEGNLYIADYMHNRIRKVDPSGVITTLSESVSAPSDVAVYEDATGNVVLYVSEFNGNRISKLDSSGTLSSVAESAGRPRGVDVDANGNVYWAAFLYNKIEMLDTFGNRVTVAGSAANARGYSGDNGPATAALLYRPYDVTVDGNGNLYIADTINNRVRRVSAGADGVVDGDADEIIVTVAGNGSFDYIPEHEGVWAATAALYQPQGVGVDEAGNLYIADTFHDRVRRVEPGADGVVDGDADELIRNFAGDGVGRFLGDGGLASDASLFRPARVVVAGETFYIADYSNQRVRKVFPRPPNQQPTAAGLGDVTVIEDAGINLITLTSFFDDAEDGPGGLSYSVENNSNPSLVATSISAGVLTLAYAGDAFGTSDVTIRATDSEGLFVDSSFTVTVTAVNDRPSTTGLNDVTVAEDATNSVVDLTAAFADVEDGAAGLAYSVAGNSDPSLVSTAVSDGTLTLSYTADAFGTAAITVRATDSGGLSVTDTFTVTVTAVNDVPSTAGLGNVAVEEDAPDTLVDLTAFFSDVEDGAAALTYAVTENGDPSLLSASVDGGLLTLDYAANAFGSAGITVRATDSGGLFVEASFTVTVTGVNDAPTSAGLGDVVVDEDAASTVIDLKMSFSDVEDDATGLVYIVVGNSNTSLVSTAVVDGRLTLGYAAEAAGTSSITVRATDSEGLFVESPITVTVNVVNDAPRFDTATVTTASENEPYAYSIATSDVEGNGITITATTLPVWLTLTDNGDGTAVLSGTPLATHVGANPVVLRATDDGTPVAVGTQSFTITVSAADNSAPTSTGLGNVTVDEDAPGTTIDLTTSFDDVEDGAANLLYSVTGNDNASLVSTSIAGGSLTLNYAPDTFGTANVTVRATDSGGLFLEDGLVVTVNGVNDPPVTTGLADVTVDEDAPDTVIDLAASFADAEDGPDGLAYSVISNSNISLVSSTISDQSLILHYTPEAAGAAAIRVLAVDSGGLTAEDVFTVKVNAVNDPPRFDSVAATDAYEGRSYTYDIRTSDPEGIGLIITAPLLPVWLTLTDNGDGTAVLNGTPGGGTLGDHAVELQVIDIDTPSGSATQTFTITVSPPVNSAPTTMGLGDVVVDEDAADTTIDLTSVFADAEDGAAALTYGVTANSNPSLVTAVADGGTLTLSYAAEASGSSNLTVRATDSEGLFVESPFTVTVNNVNDRPVTAGLGDVTVNENSADTSVELTTVFDDAEDGPAVLYYMVESNSNASLVTATLSGGTLTLSYKPEAFGVADIAVRATDSGGLYVTDTFRVTVNKVNNPPLIAEGPASTVAMDEDASPTAFSLTLNASDADGDPLIWSIATQAAHGIAKASGSGASKAITYTPFADYAGADSFVVQVVDGYGGIAPHAVTVNIAPRNDAPLVSGQNAVITPAQTALSITIDDVVVTDPDNVYPTDFSLQVVDGAGYVRSGNEIIPDAGVVGILPVLVTVHDGLAASPMFALQVSVTPAYGLPATTPQVRAGASFSAQIKSDGSLWAWGSNGSSQLGYDTTTDLDMSSTNSSTLRQQSGSDSDWAQIALGHYHAAALRTDGSLWTWGRNVEGELGDGSNLIKDVPTRIGADLDWVAVGCGEKHTVALKNDGTLWAWGYNNDGQLGNGDRLNRNAPVQVDADNFDPANPWVEVAAGGSFTLGIKLDGSLWGWGDNFFAQLGGAAIGDDSTVPVRLGPTDKVWRKASAGLYHGMAIDASGNLWAWGSNDYGQLGDGTTATRFAPVQLTSGTVWKAIEAGNYFSTALQDNGTLWTWGANDYGQLGSGNGGLGFFKETPAQIGTDTDWIGVAAGAAHTLALKLDGSVYAWGSNANGQLGDSSFNDTVAGSVSIDTVTTLTNTDSQTIAGSVGAAATSMTAKLEYVDSLGATVVVDIPVTHTLGQLIWSADINLPLEAEGESVVTVTATDGGLYTATAQNRIVYDLTPPDPPLFDDMVGVTLTNNPTPTWLWNPGGGDGFDLYQYKLDGNAWSSETAATTYTPASPLTHGLHTLYVRERDEVGNWSAIGEYSINVDRQAPGQPIVSSLVDGQAGISETRNQQPSWTWTSGGGGNGSYRYRLDGGSWSLETADTTYTHPSSLDVASHNLEVQERDASGNWSASGSFAITIDLTPPWLSALDDISTNATTQQITGMVDMDATLVVTVDTGAIVTEIINQFGNWIYEISDLSVGANVVTITATDPAGNATVKTATISLNSVPTATGLASVTVDEDAPAMTVDLTASFADVEDGASGLTYTVAGNSNASVVSASVNGSTLTLSFVANAFGSADITVRATDSGGLYVESTFTVTVNAVNDAPTTSGLAAVTVDEDAADTVIDLTTAFTDVEDGSAALAYSVVVNSEPSLLVTSVTGGDLTLAYAADAYGVANIIVRATDSKGLSVDSILTVTVNAVNDPPTTSDLTSVTVDEDAVDTVVDLTVAFADVEDGSAALIYSIENNSDVSLVTTSLTDGTLTLDYVLDAFGTTDITVQATDSGGLTVDSTFTVTVNPVNDQPTTTGLAAVTVDEDAENTTVDLTAAFVDVEDGAAGLVYSIENNSDVSLVTTSLTDGTLTLNYVADAFGSADVTVRATDNGDLSAETTFTVTVNAVNDAPQITSSVSGAGTATENVEWVYTATVADPDDANNGIELTWSLKNEPAGMTVSVTGVVTWTPEEGVETSGVVTLVVADDGEDGALPATESFIVTTTAVNDAPLIVSAAPAAATEGLEWTYAAEVVDPDDANDGVNLLWSLSNEPEGMTVSSTGLVTWTPGEGVVTSGTVVLTVADGGEDGAAAASEEFTIVVTAVNDPPVITSTAPVLGTEGVEYVYAAVVEDPDDENNGVDLTWSLENAPAGMTVSATGVVTWTPAPGTETSGAVTLTVVDGGEDAALPATEVFTVSVTVFNKAPMITSTAPAVATEGVEYVYAATVNDPDDANNGTDLLWSLSDAPAGMTVSATGVVTWTPIEGVSTSGAVTLTVADGGEDGVSPAMEEFTVVVTPVNNAPEIISTAPTEAFTGSLYSYQAEAYDSDDANNGVDLVWTLAGAPDGMAVSNNGLVTWTPAAGVTTSGSVTLTVADGGEDGASPDSQNFSIVVKENAPPSVATPIPDQVAWIGSEYVFALPTETFTDEDPAGLILTARLAGGQSLPTWLTFDGQTFSGIPSGDLATLAVEVTATDVGRLSTEPPATFNLRVGRIAPVSGMAMESGSLEVPIDVPVRFPLSKAYESPIVIAKVVTADGAVGFAQVTSVAADAFELECSVSGQSAGAAQVAYLVVETGEQSLSGLLVQAGTLTTSNHLESGQWSTATFPRPFDMPPVVFTTVQSDTDTIPNLTRSKNAVESGFETTLQGGGGGSERIGWVAIEKGVAKTSDGRHIMITTATAGEEISLFELDDEFCDLFVGSIVSDEYGKRYPDLIQRLGQQAFAPFNETLILGDLGSAYGSGAASSLTYRKADGFGLEVTVSNAGGAPAAMEDVAIFAIQ